MFLIVGLGNPESDYANTRHNMGFNVINKISEKYNIPVEKKKFKGLYGTGDIEGQKVMLLKPQTYMNLSGEAVRDFKNFYKVNPENIIIIYDDLDIEPGMMKIRKKGGPGTHNGMKSVVHELQTEDFPRIRIGIGNPEYKNDLLNYILTKIPEEDYKVLENSIKNAANAIEEIIKNSIDSAMNRFN